MNYVFPRKSLYVPKTNDTPLYQQENKKFDLKPTELSHVLNTNKIVDVPSQITPQPKVDSPKKEDPKYLEQMEKLITNVFKFLNL